MSDYSNDDIPVPKKKSRPNKWKKNIRKRKITCGEPVLNTVGKEIPERKTGPDCK